MFLLLLLLLLVLPFFVLPCAHPFSSLLLSFFFPFQFSSGLLRWKGGRESRAGKKEGRKWGSSRGAVLRGIRSDGRRERGRGERGSGGRKERGRAAELARGCFSHSEEREGEKERGEYFEIPNGGDRWWSSSSSSSSSFLLPV